MTPREKLLRLVESLTSATPSGTIPWQRTPYPNSFFVQLNPISVSLDEEFGGGYCVTVYDGESKVHDLEIFARGDEALPRVEKLYNLARRSAGGDDDLLDRAIADIESRMVSS